MAKDTPGATFKVGVSSKGAWRMDDGLCVEGCGRPIAAPRLRKCLPCKQKGYRRRVKAGLVVRDEEEFDYVRCERLLRALLYGEHLTPMPGKLTRAERIWLVQRAVQAGVTETSRIKDMLSVGTTDALRLIHLVTSGKRTAPDYDLLGRACA